MIKDDTINELIGLVPAAGKASRIQPLPCSKELLPIGFQSMGSTADASALRPKAASQYLLESMHEAGVRRAVMVINREKWDIPAYYGPGTLPGIDLAYVVTDYPYGAPFSIRQAFPFVAGATIVFGFPDIRFTPVGAFSRLLQRQIDTKADVVLGLFRAKDPSKMDMVHLDRHGEVTVIDIKPVSTSLTYTWIIAVWSPAFTAFMQAFLDEMEPALKRARRQAPAGRHAEYYVGNVFQAALKSDFKLANVIFEDGDYIDIGTPESLFSAMTHMTG